MEHTDTGLSDTECPLCLQLYYAPVTIGCGHTFCRSCLVNTLEKGPKQCPLCRTVCTVYGYTAPVNITLRNIIQRLDPERYRSREDHYNSYELPLLSIYHRLPLFCMNEPLLPHQPIQFHFFEPRYRLMTERMLAHSKYYPKEMVVFGYVNTYKPTEGIIGTLVHVHDIKFVPSTSTYFIQGTGYKKFRIKEHWIEPDTANLHKAVIEIMEDEDVNDITSLMDDAYRQLITETEAAHQRMHFTTSQSSLSSSTSLSTMEPSSSSSSTAIHPSSAVPQHNRNNNSSTDIQMDQENNPRPMASSSSFIYDLPMDPTITTNNQNNGSRNDSIHESRPENTNKPSPIPLFGISDTVKSFRFTPTELATVASDIVFQNNTDLIDKAQNEYRNLSQNILHDLSSLSSSSSSMLPSSVTKSLSALRNNNIQTDIENTLKSSSSPSASPVSSVHSLQKLYALHQALCTLRAYAIARVMAQHIQLTVSVGTNYAQFLKQYGTAPTTFNPIEGGQQIHRLSNWLTSVVTLPPEQRIQLSDLTSTYARLWGCIIALWDKHGFGYLPLETIYGFVHHGQNNAKVLIALTNAENAVFSVGETSSTTTPNSSVIGTGSTNPTGSHCRMRNMWSWLQTSLRNENTASSNSSINSVSNTSGNYPPLSVSTSEYGSSGTTVASSSATDNFNLYQHQFNDVLIELENYDRSYSLVSSSLSSPTNPKQSQPTDNEDPPFHLNGSTVAVHHVPQGNHTLAPSFGNHNNTKDADDMDI